MASLKTIASQACGITGGFSLVKNFFGFMFYDSNQTFVNALSLKNQITLVKGKSIHISAILVGADDFAFGGSSAVTLTQAQDFQAAIQRMRDLYAQAPLGIRKIYWSRIGVSQAGSYINITNSSEAEDLTDDWNGDNDGIDVFLVQSIGDAGGWSNVNGPCDKDSICGRTGIVIEVTSGQFFFGILLAHEVGHYLGLSGGVGPNNLMGAVAIGGVDQLSNNTTQINSSQASTMRSGCYVKNAL